MSAGNAYTTAEGLVPAVQSGALAPLRSSFLKRLVESGEALQKRQDLPEAAFWDVAAFQRLTESEEDCMASIFALSYRWLTAEHPDPDSFHLSKVVAFLEVHKAWVEKMGINVDDCAVFWDFGSLFQPERTHDQKVLFREGLRASNVWYGSYHTTVLIQSHLPPGFTATPYSQSGWCFVEATISSVIKYERRAVRHGSLGAGRCGNLVMDEDFEDCHGALHGPSLRAPQARRRPPPPPYREEVYDGRGQGSRGGLVRELLQRRRWQLHQVGLHMAWVGRTRRSATSPVPCASSKSWKSCSWGNKIGDEGAVA